MDFGLIFSGIVRNDIDQHFNDEVLSSYFKFRRFCKPQGWSWWCHQLFRYLEDGSLFQRLSIASQKCYESMIRPWFVKDLNLILIFDSWSFISPCFESVFQKRRFKLTKTENLTGSRIFACESRNSCRKKKRKQINL